MRFEARLMDIYDNFLNKNDLPHMSADDLYWEIYPDEPEGMTPTVKTQLDWLRRFIRVWDEAERR